jgi:FkbH-like protein
MQLREAMAEIRGAKRDPARKAALLCSFEPLHLKTYLEGHLAAELDGALPEVETFGFDQLEAGLAATETRLKSSPALLFLSWNDLHPALTWRSRGCFSPIAGDELAGFGERLEQRLISWLGARAGSETALMAAPAEWLPALDPHPVGALGPTALAATAALARVKHAFAEKGGKVLETPALPLNFRDLLLGGFPMTLDGAEAVAAAFVSACFKTPGRKKALILDLDGTLWGGTIGEDGPEGLHYRSEGLGYPHHVFQKFARKLKDEGVLLALCSKNNPDEALPHFDRFEMPLKLSDFSAVRCDWEPKPENIKAIAAEFNIGLDAIVFVDDNDVELGEVRSRLPEVVSLKTPSDGLSWQALYAQLRDHFGAWSVSETDRLRAASLAARPKTPATASCNAEYLRELGLELTIDPEAFKDPRSLDLVNKTNQFNLTGERLTSEEWLRLASSPGAFCVSARLKDRFGDFGTICVATGTAVGSELFLRQFVLSCRVFGRGVESIVLGELARRFSAKTVSGAFKPTPKNEPARRFLALLGWPATEPGDWTITGQAAGLELKRALDLTGAKVGATR